MPLMSAKELDELMVGGRPVVVVDVRFSLADHAKGRRDYEEGHLPAAVFIDLHTELADTAIPSAGRHPLPAPADFVTALSARGIGPGTTVVAYDDCGGATASRLWWMLDSIGHTQAWVLDGGIGAWTERGLPLVAGPEPSPSPSHYPDPPGWYNTVSATDIAQRERTATLVDARSPERFRGEHEPIDARAGHIPGAVNRFHGDVVNADATFKSPNELAAFFGDLGSAPVVYCGSGVTACHLLLAMRIADIDDARLYPGSWSQWCSDPERPVEIG